MRKNFIFGIAAVFVFAVCAPLHAGVIAGDSFLIGTGEHTAGSPVVGQSCGVGWSDVWTVESGTGPGWVSDPVGLVSDCGAGVGGAARLSDPGTTNTNLRRYVADYTAPDTYWFNQITVATGTESQISNARLLTYWQTDDGNKMLRFSLRYGDVYACFAPYSNRYLLQDGYTSGDLLHFLAKVEVDYEGGAADRVQIWLNPADCSSEASLGTPTLDETSQDIFSSTNILDHYQAQAINFNGTGMTAAVDELIVGTSLEDVVIPEPSTVMLLLIGGLALFSLRLRSKN